MAERVAKFENWTAPLSDLNDIYAHIANNPTKHGLIEFPPLPASHRHGVADDFNSATALGDRTIVVATMYSGIKSRSRE
jgi:hypothetical protein